MHTPTMGVICAQAARVMIRVRRATDSSVPTAQLFATPSIAGLAEAMERLALADGSGAAQAGIPRAGYSDKERAAGVPCSANQEQMLVLHQLAPESAMYNMMEPITLASPADTAALQARIHAPCSADAGQGFLVD